MKDLSKTEIGKIKKRAQAASPGPWTWEWVCVSIGVMCSWKGYVKNLRGRDIPSNYHNQRSASTPPNFDHADASFIAHARTDVLKLIAKIEKLQAEVKIMRKK